MQFDGKFQFLPIAEPLCAFCCKDLNVHLLTKYNFEPVSPRLIIFLIIHCTYLFRQYFRILIIDLLR